MTLLVKPISQLPLATVSTGTDNIIVNQDNGDSTDTTRRITATNLAGSAPFISAIQGNKVNVTHAMSPYAMQAADEFLICDTSGGNIVINLVGATLHKLPGVTIENDAGTGIITMVANGADTIRGSNIIAFPGQSYVYKSDLISKWRAT